MTEFDNPTTKQVKDHLAAKFDLPTKVINKICADLDPGQIIEWIEKTEPELETCIAECVMQVREEKQKLEENEEYQLVCNNKKLFDSAFREATKPIKTAQLLATYLISHHRGKPLSEKMTQNLQEGETLEISTNTPEGVKTVTLENKF